MFRVFCCGNICSFPSWGQSMRVRATGSANAFLVTFESGFLPLATSMVAPPLFPSYSPGGSKVVYMHHGKYLSFLVLEICSSSSLLTASFNERFKHNQNICNVDAETCLGPGGPVLQKPVLLTAIIAKLGKALCQLSHLYGNSCSAKLFSHFSCKIIHV